MSKRNKRNKNNNNKQHTVGLEEYKEFCEFRALKSSLTYHTFDLIRSFNAHKLYLVTELQVEAKCDEISAVISKIVDVLKLKNDNKHNDKRNNKHHSRVIICSVSLILNKQVHLCFKKTEVNIHG